MSRTQKRSASARQDRREACEKRNAEWRELTPAQQLAELDARLGKGIGAARQRAKLNAILAPKDTVSIDMNVVGDTLVSDSPLASPRKFASKSEERRWNHMKKVKK